MESMSASPFVKLQQDKYLLIEVYTYVDYQAILKFMYGLN